jgi:hypothetical protein
MLDYNIAYDSKHKQKIGCLSKSMVLVLKNKLTEGKRIWQDLTLNIIRCRQKDYTFQFICNALKVFFRLYYQNIIEIIVFDSIIGNSDRQLRELGYNKNIK